MMQDGSTRLGQELVRCQLFNKDKAAVVSQGLRCWFNLSSKIHYAEILSALNVALFRDGAFAEKWK